VDRSTRPDLPEGPGFWLALAGVFAALGGVGIGIGITEYHPPWSSAWFIAGATLSALGCACAIWSLILYLAHKQAAGHWCPDRPAHVPQAAQATVRADQVTEDNPRAAVDEAKSMDEGWTVRALRMAPQAAAVAGIVLLAAACGGGPTASSSPTTGRGHIYWTNGYWIGRANLDGSGVNQRFIITKHIISRWGLDGMAVDPGQ
jgi:hypothetical protein